MTHDEFTFALDVLTDDQAKALADRRRREMILVFGDAAKSVAATEAVKASLLKQRDNLIAESIPRTEEKEGVK